MHDYLVALVAILVPVALALTGKFIVWSLGQSIGDRVERIMDPKLSAVHDRIDRHMDAEEEVMEMSRARDEWQVQAILRIAQDRGVRLDPPPIWTPSSVESRPLS